MLGEGSGLHQLSQDTLDQGTDLSRIDGEMTAIEAEVVIDTAGAEIEAGIGIAVMIDMIEGPQGTKNQRILHFEVFV